MKLSDITTHLDDREIYNAPALVTIGKQLGYIRTEKEAETTLQALRGVLHRRLDPLSLDGLTRVLGCPPTGGWCGRRIKGLFAVSPKQPIREWLRTMSRQFHTFRLKRKTARSEAPDYIAVIHKANQEASLMAESGGFQRETQATRALLRALWPDC